MKKNIWYVAFHDITYHSLTQLGCLEKTAKFGSPTVTSDSDFNPYYMDQLRLTKPHDVWGQLTRPRYKE